MNALFFLAALCASQPTWAESSADVVNELASVELPEPPLEDPPDAETAAARTDRLQTNLRCPVCQGLSVADSPSDAARAMGTRIEELVNQGYTEDQITSYFVDRYGAWVELEPPDEDHKALFLAPVALVAIGGILLLAWGRNGRKRAVQSDESKTPTHTPDPTLEPWRTRILNELGEAN